MLCEVARACQGILLTLDQDPSNLDLRLILADAYEDAGEVEVARFWRWVHREKRSPHAGMVQFSVGPPHLLWYWTYDSNEIYPHRDKPEFPLRATLPDKIFRAEVWDTLAEARHNGAWHYLPTWLAAMEAALTAWQSLPYERRPC